MTSDIPYDLTTDDIVIGTTGVLLTLLGTVLLHVRQHRTYRPTTTAWTSVSAGIPASIIGFALNPLTRAIQLPNAIPSAAAAPLLITPLLVNQLNRGLQPSHIPWFYTLMVLGMVLAAGAILSESLGTQTTLGDIAAGCVPATTTMRLITLFSNTKIRNQYEIQMALRFRQLILSMMGKLMMDVMLVTSLGLAGNLAERMTLAVIAIALDIGLNAYHQYALTNKTKSFCPDAQSARRELLKKIIAPATPILSQMYCFNHIWLLHLSEKSRAPSTKKPLITLSIFAIALLLMGSLLVTNIITAYSHITINGTMASGKEAYALPNSNTDYRWLSLSTAGIGFLAGFACALWVDKKNGDGRRLEQDRARRGSQSAGITSTRRKQPFSRLNPLIAMTVDTRDAPAPEDATKAESTYTPPAPPRRSGSPHSDSA